MITKVEFVGQPATSLDKSAHRKLGFERFEFVGVSWANPDVASERLRILFLQLGLRATGKTS